MKKLITLTLTLIMLMSAFSVLAEENADVILNGHKIAFPNQRPIVTEGVVLAPPEEVFGILGATVDWEGNSEKVTILYKEIELQLQVDEIMYIKRDSEGRETRRLQSGVAPKLYSGRAFIPLKDVSELLGFSVVWEGGTNAIIISTTAAPTPMPTPTPQTANVTVDGVKAVFDQLPIVVDGRTLVPIRAVAEQIGAEVGWTEATQTATVTYKNTALELQIGNINMTVRNLSTSVRRTIKLDVPPQTYNSRTLLPIRAVVEEFGCKVGWDDATGTVVITKPRKTIVIGE